MSERLLEKLDRLGAEAGIETMTPAIRRFALLVRNDVVSGWPASKPWVGLTDVERAEVQYEAHKKKLTPLEFMELHEAKLREKNA